MALMPMGLRRPEEEDELDGLLAPKPPIGDPINDGPLMSPRQPEVPPAPRFPALGGGGIAHPPPSAAPRLPPTIGGGGPSFVEPPLTLGAPAPRPTPMVGGGGMSPAPMSMPTGFNPTPPRPTPLPLNAPMLTPPGRAGGSPGLGLGTAPPMPREVTQGATGTQPLGRSPPPLNLPQLPSMRSPIPGATNPVGGATFKPSPVEKFGQNPMSLGPMKPQAMVEPVDMLPTVGMPGGMDPLAKPMGLRQPMPRATDLGGMTAAPATPSFRLNVPPERSSTPPSTAPAFNAPGLSLPQTPANVTPMQPTYAPPAGPTTGSSPLASNLPPGMREAVLKMLMERTQASAQRRGLAGAGR